MSTDADRRELYDALVTNLGPGPAGTLMASLMFPGDREQLARQTDLLALRADFVGLRGEFAELRGEFAELRGEFGELRGEVRALESRIDSQLSKLIAANAVTAVAVTGLAFAAARLAG